MWCIAFWYFLLELALRGSLQERTWRSLCILDANFPCIDANLTEPDLN